MPAIFSHLLPSPANYRICGPMLTWVVFVLLALDSTAGGLIHRLALNFWGPRSSKPHAAREGAPRKVSGR